MRLTARGWTVLAVLAIAIALSWFHGPRSLNAVVTPLAVALVAGLVLTARVDRPTVHRHPIPDGAVGETRTVALTLECTDTISATVDDAVGDGLAAAEPAGATVPTMIDGEERIAYDVTLERRGEHVVGPVSITVTDVFGLVERRFSDAETTAVLAYPAAAELGGESAGDLQALENAAGVPDREEFDHLREYHRGDSLRDVHWKSAAKRPDDELVVTEYADEADAGAIEIAAECEPGQAEPLVRAVASVTIYLLERDRRIGVTIGDERLPPGGTREHRSELLGLLAVTDGGPLEDGDRERADVLVTADWRDVRLVVDDRTIPFERLVSDTARSNGNGNEHPVGSSRRRRRDRESGVIA